MAKWFDMTVSGTDHAGTTENPFSIADLIAHVDSVDTETYYGRGEGETASWFSWAAGSVAHVFLPWDSVRYGPFRINQTGGQSLLIKGTWEGCIISKQKSGGEIVNITEATFRTVALLVSRDELSHIIVWLGCVFEGCLISSGQFKGSGNVTLKDCVLDAAVWGGPPP